MSVAGSENLAPRPSAKPLAWALLISLAVHLVALVAIPFVYMTLVALAIIAKPHTPPPQNQKPQSKVTEDLPLIFTEVDPSQAVKEAPKNAKYYSSQNSKAANPDAKLLTDQPKIDGRQTHVPKTQTAEKPKAFPLQPTPKPPAPEGQADSKKKTAPKVGDLAMAKPADKPPDKPAEKPDAQVGEPPKHVRPRTLAQAEAQNPSMLGEKMKQDGGVKDRRMSPSFDAKGTTFGAYDAAFIDAVSKHWYGLLDEQHNSELRTGRVVLEFNLNYDGRITDMKVIEGDDQGMMTYICKRAILDPAPFEPWPIDMRRIIGSDRREIRFTFYYE